MQLHGTLVSSALGTFGKSEILYGYIGLEKEDGSHIRIKVDSYTWYETLDVGSKVVIEVETLGATDILVARKISFQTDLSSGQDEQAKASA